MSKQTFIYTLTDPRTNEVRYVGKTTNPKARLASHRSRGTAASRGLDKWKRELRANEMRPEFAIVDRCSSDESDRVEDEWMLHFTKAGNRLINQRGMLMSRYRFKQLFRRR